MKTRAFLVALVMALAATVGHAGVQLDLYYGFEAGAKVDATISAKIDQVEMGAGVPLAVTGEATMDFSLEVMDVDEDGVATIVVSFGEINAQMMGRAQKTQSPSPTMLRVDTKGRVLSVVSEDGPELDLFGGGGVPLQMVVMLACIVELPTAPIELTECWTLERSQDLPDIGQVSTTVISELAGLDTLEAAFLTDISASLPDFTTSNPMQDNNITVRNGILKVENMKRTVDVPTGLISAGEAKIAFNGMAAIGEFVQLPLSLTSSFTIQTR